MTGRPYAFAAALGKAGGGAGARWVVFARLTSSMQTGRSRFSYSAGRDRQRTCLEAVEVVAQTFKVHVACASAAVEDGKAELLAGLSGAIEFHDGQDAFENLTAEYGGFVKPRTQHQNIAANVTTLK